MPLLQDTSRGGGGPNENRRSLADFLGFDATRIEPAAAPSNHRGNDCKGEEWRWEEARSPQAAQTPRALVPPTCFPPRHPTAFASFSESARPGTGWNDDSSSQGITDLVTSLKALAMPSVPAAARRLETSIQMRLSYEASEQNSDTWAADPPQTSLPRDERYISRRASFCGVDCRGGGGGGTSGGAARWSGVLPARGEVVAEYSPKLFMGGLPFDISEQALMHALRHFHPVRVEWPGRENNGSSSLGPRGFAYVTFESERRVRALLAASRRDGTDWYYRVSTRKIRTKEVIPWAVCDASWVCGGCTRLEPARTVFVGALHGMLSAHALATIMNDLFQGVVYAGIDTDKNKYPIGSGRVTFNNVHSYVRAISAAYVEITTDKFTKKVQVDPYLEDSMCSECNLHQGPYFCRQPMCFRYFCRGCWVWRHGAGAAGGAAGVEHKPLTRSARTHNNHGNTHSPPASTHAIDGIPSPSTSGNNEATPSPDEPLESDSVWEPR